MQQISPELLHGSASEYCYKTEHRYILRKIWPDDSRIFGDEIHDFSNSLHRFSAGRSLLLHTELADE